MRIKKYSFDEYTTNNASIALYLSAQETDDPKRNRMMKILKTALQNELTQRQRECINMYYMENRKVKEISDIMSIKPSTVYKHLKTGLNALKKASLYL